MTRQDPSSHGFDCIAHLVRTKKNKEQSCELTVARNRRGGERKITQTYPNLKLDKNDCPCQTRTFCDQTLHWLQTSVTKLSALRAVASHGHLYGVLMLSKLSFVLMSYHNPVISAAGFLSVYRNLTHYQMLFVFIVGEMCRQSYCLLLNICDSAAAAVRRSAATMAWELTWRVKAPSWM